MFFFLSKGPEGEMVEMDCQDEMAEMEPQDEMEPKEHKDWGEALVSQDHLAHEVCKLL